MTQEYEGQLAALKREQAANLVQHEQVAREARGAAEAALSLQQEAADLGAALSLLKADTEAAQRRSAVQLREELLARWGESHERVLSAQRELAQQQDSARQDQMAATTALASLQRRVQQEMQPAVDHLAAAVAASDAKATALTQMLLDANQRQRTALSGAVEGDAALSSSGKSGKGNKKRANPISGTTKVVKPVSSKKLLSASEKSSILTVSNRSNEGNNDDLIEGHSVHSNTSSSSPRYSPSSLRRLSKVLSEEAMAVNEEGEDELDLDEDDDEDEEVEDMELPSPMGQGPGPALVHRFDDLKLAQVNQQLAQLHAASLVAAEEIGRLRGSQIAGEQAQQRSVVQLGDLQRSLVFVEGRMQAVDGDLHRGLADALRRIDDVSEQVKILLRYNITGSVHHDTTPTSSAAPPPHSSTSPTSASSVHHDSSTSTTTAADAMPIMPIVSSTTEAAATIITPVGTTTTSTDAVSAMAATVSTTSLTTAVPIASGDNLSGSASTKGTNKVSFGDDDADGGANGAKSLLGRLWDKNDEDMATTATQPPSTSGGSTSAGGADSVPKVNTKAVTTASDATTKTTIAATPLPAKSARTPVQGKLGPISPRPRADSESSEGSERKVDLLATNSINSSSDDNDLVRARREERRTKVTSPSFLLSFSQFSSHFFSSH